MALNLKLGEEWRKKAFVEVQLYSFTVGGISYNWKGKFVAATAGAK